MYRKPNCFLWHRHASCPPNFVFAYLADLYSLKTIKKNVVVSFIKCNFGGYLVFTDKSFLYGKYLLQTYTIFTNLNWKWLYASDNTLTKKYQEICPQYFSACILNMNTYISLLTYLIHSFSAFDFIMCGSHWMRFGFGHWWDLTNAFPPSWMFMASSYFPLWLWLHFGRRRSGGRGRKLQTIGCQ